MPLEIRPPRRARAAAPLALALLLFSVLAAGCNTASDTGHGPAGANSNSANSSNAPVGAAPSADTSPAASASPAAATPAGLSPTEAVRGYYEAGVRKDFAGVKRFLSRDSLRLMEDLAKREGKTLEQLFGAAAEMETRRPQPAFSNERITGDTAYVDIKAPGQSSVTMRLVKEDGEWKLAFGKPKG
jgi:hypothetical protein